MKKNNYYILTILFFLISIIFFNNLSAQVTLTNAVKTATIDFSAATPINVGTNPATAFSGAGFEPNPSASGRLNSNAWAVTGWSDGSLVFGGTQITTLTDYRRNSSGVSVSTGGFYAYTGSPQTASNPALMIQPGGSDFAPGNLTLKIVNNGTTAITDYTISYNIYVRNDQGRSSSFDFSYSSDNVSYTNVSSVGYTTTTTSDALGWVLVGSSPSRQTAITSLSINPGASFFIRWSSADVAGTGSRDEIGLDDIIIQSNFVTSGSTPTVAITAQDPNTPTSVNWGIGSSLNQFYWAAITPSTSAATLSSVSANMTGNYVAADIAASGFKLYYSPDFTFNPTTGDVFLGQQSSSTGNGETINWSGFTQSIPAGSTGYIYATADIASTAQAGRNLAGSFTGNTNIIFSPTVTYSVSNTYGSTTNKTFALLPTNPSTFSVSCSSEANIKVSMSAITSGTVLVFANTGTTFTAPTGSGSSFVGANNNFASATNYSAVGGRLVYSGVGSNFTVTGLTAGLTYSLIAYSYNGSNWSSGTSIITGTAITQPVAATVVTPNSGQIQLSWTNPSATACNNNVIVIARQGSPVEASISKTNFDNLLSDADFTGASATWTLNSNTNDVHDLTLGLLSTTDNTNFLVYKGTGNTVTLNGLSNGTPYYFRIFTVDGIGSAAKWSAAVDANGTPGLPGSYWNTNGISAAWTSANWGSSGSGPFTNAWVNGNNAFFTANSNLTFATTTFGDVIVDPGLTVTVSQGGTASGNSVRTYNVGIGSTLTWVNQTLPNSSGFGIIKNGGGTWSMGANSNPFNSTNGGYTLNDGLVILNGVNCFGGSSSVLSINGGSIQTTGGNAFPNTTINIGGNFALSGTGNDVYSGAVNLGAATRIITNNTTSGTRRFSGIISGGVAATGITIDGAGAGLIQITNTANTYSGTVSFLGAETEMNGDGSFGAVPSSVNPSAIIINGGRMTFTASAFTLNSNRGIKVGSGSNNEISVKNSATSVTYNGIISDLLSNGSWAKQGANRLILGGQSVYTGITAINNGTVQLSLGNNILPTTTTLSIGQAASTNLGVLDLNGRNQQVAGLNSTTGTNATASNNTINSATGATLTIGDAGTYAYGDGSPANSGIITGAISIVKIGAGIQTLGDINSYTGSTQINQGELRFSPNANENLSSSAVILNGGTLGTSGISLNSVISFSTLTTVNSSTINLSSINSHTLNFASSSSTSWSGTLTITGWQGNYCGSGTATKGKITIGTNSLSLTSSQLAQILFFDGTNYYPAKLSTTGELIPDGFPFITIAASSNSPLCSGNNLFLNVSAKGTPSPTYSWSGPNSYTANNPSASIINVSFLSSGIYTASATNSCGTATSAIAVTVNTTPTLSPISDINICQNKLVNTTFTSTPTGSTFIWSNSNTNIGLTSSGTGNISFTSSLVPSNQTAIITVTPQLNSCIGLSQSFSITVNGDPSSSIWTGAISSDWFDSDNWTNCVCGSATNATITSVISPNFNPIINGSIAAYVNNLEINPSASLSIQSTQTLNVTGDFINNGNFNSSQGLVSLSGSSNQTIGGTSRTDFYDLQLNNSFGASLSNTVGITGSLYPTTGTFNTNGKLMLLASLSQSGRIAEISSSADVVGNVTVQQFAKGGHTGWALLGAPINSSITMADWNDDFAITCASCPNGSQSGFTSISSYDETAAGSFSSTAKYVLITSISNSITNGQGYWVYLGNGYPNTTNIIFDVNGSVAKSSCLTCTSSINIPISYTNNNPSSDDNGWNLIANPLPSPISWTALRNGNANVEDAIYLYNTDLLNGSGNYTSYINGISSDITGGIGDAIPMCQAFYIHATAPTTLIANENTKVFSTQLLLKNNTLSVKPIARLIMNGGNSSLMDMTTLYFEAGATNLFEKNYDAYKLINDPSLPYIGTLSSNKLISINGLPDLSTNISVPVKAIVNSTQSYTFSILKSDFPTSVCINLYDSYTGITTNLSNSTYSCLLYDTTQTPRFTLNFTTLPLSGTIISNQPICSAPNSGNIIVVGNNSGPWDFEWRDSNNIIVKTSYNKSNADTLDSLSSGNYKIKINTTGQCDLYSNTISINPIILPFADFTINTDTIYISNNTQFLITNTSLNCNTFNWNFGDMSGNDNSINPYHIYNSAGTYSITLITESISGCLDSIKKIIVVINDVTNIKDILDLEKSYQLFYFQNSTSYCLKINLKENSSIDINIFDISGKSIIDDKLLNIKNKNYTFNLEDKADGIYFLQVSSNHGEFNSFKLKK